MKLILLLNLLMLNFSFLYAMQFQVFDYKSAGMGGASVANSTGSTAIYSNPALLAYAKKPVEFSLSVGVTTLDHGAGTVFKALEKIKFLDTLDKASEDVFNLTQEDRENIIKAVL